ncbi:MAG: hypothetical protein C5B49_10730 [Bdellovibrio sp.]|nr:MAG: hypothetical protein C5B49_10730 [Bdellovibrio sp.]
MTFLCARWKNLAVLLFILNAETVLASDSLYCSDIAAVAAEAVAYYLTGASDSELPLRCAEQKKWKYFNPKWETRTPEPKSNKPPPEIIWFDPKKDSYKIGKIHKVSQRKHLIDVTFSIKGKSLKTTYSFTFWDVYQKARGTCGYVENENRPPIFREDCRH